MKKWLPVLLIAAIVAVTAFTPRKITWVAIGDSITYLNEHPDETGNRITKGYLTRVTEKLPDIQYVNKGYNGWTSGGIADAIEKLDLVKADVYSVFLGTNDWWGGRPVGTFSDYLHKTGNSTVYGAFRTIIDKLKSLNKKAHIILITPLQRGDFVYIADMHNNAWGSYKEKKGQQLSQVVAAIDSIAGYEHFDKLDLYHNSGITLENMVKYKRLKDPATGEYKDYHWPEYKDIPFHPDTDEYPYPVSAIDMTYDGLHPSDKGFAVIADMLVEIMKRY
ncbi:SGNH/GDSL hydrolase family protein [Chitinophaga ginsengisegetis]|uniref:SGNH/GDSL hydrolase family protein n=1 Tax=Chitinophaga ginsengisegetis TaxID=393003 RepID=UPI000DB98773|nr:SGNH/GDSL hydrolase family protein [Chitinophaga ginsengisegetis]MDR6570010.1 lysophospholipase L1-like esterase [Chitinophaga ginsengisegetis]MDR6649743.1 lysophospholipase L1-like esterase [Chitinophaga ginsengisegetis]MDR6656054.1 lysophospholipase L1-like esterase [Chitinophaga ginsengisegetis]